MPDIDKLDIKKILIIDLAFIGDVILSGPLTMAIRQKWPEAELVMLTVRLWRRCCLLLTGCWPMTKRAPIEALGACGRWQRSCGVSGLIWLSA